jgi:hypothetical protein
VLSCVVRGAVTDARPVQGVSPSVEENGSGASRRRGLGTIRTVGPQAKKERKKERKKEGRRKEGRFLAHE